MKTFAAALITAVFTTGPREPARPSTNSIAGPGHSRSDAHQSVTTSWVGTGSVTASAAAA